MYEVNKYVNTQTYLVYVNTYISAYIPCYVPNDTCPLHYLPVARNNLSMVMLYLKRQQPLLELP